MDCRASQNLLVEYADGALNAGRRAQVQAHLAGCPECARLTGEVAAARDLLRALPPRQMSSHFESRLAERLALTPRPAPLPSWAERIAAGLRTPPRVLRPALALGAAAAAIVAVVLYPVAPPAAPVAPAPPVSESALVSQCVEQHQSVAAAQPLSDPAAQNLTAHMSDTVTVVPAPPTDAAVVEDNL